MLVLNSESINKSDELVIYEPCGLFLTIKSMSLEGREIMGNA